SVSPAYANNNAPAPASNVTPWPDPVCRVSVPTRSLKVMPFADVTLMLIVESTARRALTDSVPGLPPPSAAAMAPGVVSNRNASRLPLPLAPKITVMLLAGSVRSSSRVTRSGGAFRRGFFDNMGDSHRGQHPSLGGPDRGHREF